MRSGILAALLGATVLVNASPARAGWRIDRATKIAKIVWHHPNVDRMTIRWGPVPPEIPGSPAWTWVVDGVIWIGNAQPLPWQEFCAVVLHEAGHLAGMGHTERGIMSYHTELWIDTEPRCRDRGRPFLLAHGATL